MMRVSVGRMMFAALVPLLGACDGDGTGVDRLTPEDVQGIYQVCELRFTPTASFLSPVDIRTSAFEVQNTAVTQPRLLLNRDQTFEFEYTPKGQFSDVEVPGTFQLSPNEVVVRFPTGASATAAASLLLPDRVTLLFNEGTRVATATALGPYTVTRDNYARLAGLTAEERNQLAAQIEGRLNARLAPSCS